MCRCTAIVRLSLHINALRELPGTLGQMSRMEALSLQRNRLTALPAEISDCVALRELAVHENALMRLPPSLGRLPRLTELWAFRNELEELPEELGALPAIRCDAACGVPVCEAARDHFGLHLALPAMRCAADPRSHR